MDLSVNSKSSHLNKTTYINLRWIGIIGQFITINSVAFIFKFELPSSQPLYRLTNPAASVATIDSKIGIKIFLFIDSKPKT